MSGLYRDRNLASLRGCFWGLKVENKFMKRSALLIAACICFALSSRAAAIPTDVTYQGTLKEKGIPASGPKSMLFRITNQDGTQVYWSSANMSVDVVNGLFSAHINPAGVDWQNVTPYIEVSVEGQLLLPREPVSTTVYAVISSSVVDGAISPTKIMSGYGLVPSGMIAIYASDCPAGWTRFSMLDNAFPMGAAAYGTTGGAATHTHPISTDGAHNHSGWTGRGDSPDISNAGANFGNQDGWHRHSISTDGAHNHGGATGSASSLPPYVTVVYCQKL